MQNNGVQPMDATEVSTAAGKAPTDKKQRNNESNKVQVYTSSVSAAKRKFEAVKEKVGAEATDFEEEVSMFFDAQAEIYEELASQFDELLSQ